MGIFDIFNKEIQAQHALEKIKSISNELINLRSKGESERIKPLMEEYIKALVDMKRYSDTQTVLKFKLEEELMYPSLAENLMTKATYIFPLGQQGGSNYLVNMSECYRHVFGDWNEKKPTKIALEEQWQNRWILFLQAMESKGLVWDIQNGGRIFFIDAMVIIRMLGIFIPDLLVNALSKQQVDNFRYLLNNPSNFLLKDYSKSPVDFIINREKIENKILYDIFRLVRHDI